MQTNTFFLKASGLTYHDLRRISYRETHSHITPISARQATNNNEGSSNPTRQDQISAPRITLFPITMPSLLKIVNNRQDRLSSLEPRNHTTVDHKYSNIGTKQNENLKAVCMEVLHVLKEEMDKIHKEICKNTMESH